MSIDLAGPMYWYIAFQYNNIERAKRKADELSFYFNALNDAVKWVYTNYAGKKSPTYREIFTHHPTIAPLLYELYGGDQRYKSGDIMRVMELETLPVIDNFVILHIDLCFFCHSTIVKMAEVTSANSYNYCCREIAKNQRGFYPAALKNGIIAGSWKQEKELYELRIKGQKEQIDDLKENVVQLKKQLEDERNFWSNGGPDINAKGV